MDNKNKIDLTKSKRPETSEIKVTDEYNSDRSFPITGELPLTIYLDKKEIVTLMTLGPVSYTHLTLPTICSV